MFNPDYANDLNGDDNSRHSWKSKAISVIIVIAAASVAIFLFWYQVIQGLE